MTPSIELSDYTGILRELADLRLVPHASFPAPAAKQLFARLLAQVPHFFMDNGNLFIGAVHPDEIQKNRLCLQAHLDHPGGILKAADSKKHLFAQVKGFSQPASLLGYELGAFSLSTGEHAADLEVEQVYSGREGAFAFFFPQAAALEARAGETFVVCHSAAFKEEDGYISSWNLDDMLNCAEIIRQIRKHPAGELYGLLTVDEETGHNGIKFFLENFREKELLLLNMDVVSDKTTLGNAPAGTEFGFRRTQAGVKLDECMPPAVEQRFSGHARADIPSGKCEAVTAVSGGAKALAVFVCIENFHNGNNRKQFLPERINTAVLSRYLEFIDNVVDALKKTRLPAMSATNTGGQILVTDLSGKISAMFSSAADFSGFLNNHLPELTRIFSDLGLSAPELHSGNYASYTGKADVKTIRAALAAIDLHQLRDKTLARLKQALPAHGFTALPDLEIIFLLFGRFNACNISSPRRAIILSLDRISPDDIERVLVHEMTHYYTDSAINHTSRVAGREALYYSEGLATAISAEVLGLPMAKALGMPEKKYAALCARKPQLEGWMKDYLAGDFMRLHEGKYHRYFIENPIPHPFLASEDAASRYGYFLAALETAELIDKGLFYDRLLQKPVS